MTAQDVAGLAVLTGALAGLAYLSWPRGSGRTAMVSYAGAGAFVVFLLALMSPKPTWPPATVTVLYFLWCLGAVAMVISGLIYRLVTRNQHKQPPPWQPPQGPWRDGR